MNNFFSRGFYVIGLLFLAINSIAQGNNVAKESIDPSKATGTSFPATIKVAPNPKLKGNGIKRSLVGKNYRDEWITPVEVPVLRLKEAYGGLKPTKQGGGKQTKSLRVENSAGK